MLNIDKFKEDIKFNNHIDFLNYVLDVYASVDFSFNSNDGNDLRELFRKDESSAGLINAQDKNNFLSKRLMIDFMKHIGVYEQYMKATDQNDKDQLYKGVSAKVKESIAKYPGYLIFDSVALMGKPSQGTIEHEFSLNVNAADLYNVVKSLYVTARDNDIDFFITVPNRSKEAKGVNDGISIICSTDNLESTIRLFDLLPEDTKKLCKTPCPFGANLDGWIGYTSMDNDRGEEMSAIVGASFITGIDKALFEFSTQIPELVPVVSELANSTNRDAIRIQALNLLKNSNEDLYRSILNYVVQELDNNEVDLNNMFLSKGVKQNIEIAYGSPLEEEEVPAEVIEERVVDVTTPEIVVEETSEYKPVELGEDNVISVAALFNDAENVSEEVPEGDFLTDEERTSLIEDGIVPQEEIEEIVEEVQEIDPANRVKYNEIGIGNDKLDSLVINEKGKTVTLYKYLEDNQTLIKIPVNSQVVLATDVGSKDSGSVISGAVFITDTVVEYVTKLGEISLDEIIERYATDIKEEEIKKKGFFGGLFAKK